MSASNIAVQWMVSWCCRKDHKL